MATPLVMPKLGNSVESSIIVAWKKRVGDPVNEGDVIAEVETDKAVQEITAPASGVLLATFYEAGDDVPVMVNIAMIGEAGEAINLAPQPPPEHENKANLTPQPPLHFVERGSSDLPIAISPRARGLAERKNVSLAGIVGTGAGGRIMERDIQAALDRQPRLTPLAQAKVDGGEYSAPSSASGRRITTRDLIPNTPIQTDEPDTSKTTPLKGVRKVIAARMLDSLRTTAQLTLNTSADARALQAYRKRLKDSVEPLGLRGVTINDLIMFATVRTLMQFPDLNAHLKDSAITQYEHVNLGFAVDTERGLIVPVIKNAHECSLRALAAESARLAAACQAGTVKAEELDGGTFTVSNLGSLGIESFTPILNPPQVGILGVGTIQLKSLDVDGDIEFIPHIGLSLTIDHQAVDGAPGARFLQALARNIAQFDLLLAL